MKLYITETSPYARMARIMVLEKGLEDRVEILPARTRQAGSPYYEINPSGRVPYLICDDDWRLEESQLICAHFDHLAGPPAFAPPPGRDGWEVRRLEALARSLLDGLGVWGRELKRPEADRSATVVAHERERARRLVDLWEREIETPPMAEPFRNMAQLTLAVALEMDARLPGFDWRPDHPKLAAWLVPFAQRPSFAATLPGASKTG